MRRILFFTFLVGIIPTLSAQDTSDKKYLIEVNFGGGITGLHATPADVYDIAGNNQAPEEQNIRWGSMMKINVAKRLGKRHFVGVTVGYTDYRYRDAGVAVDGAGLSTDYEQILRFRFVDLGIFHKLLLVSKGRHGLLLENGLSLDYGGDIYDETKFLEFKFRNNYLFEGSNIKYTLGLKYVHTLTDWAELQGGAYYMTAINDYNIESRFEPYSFGLVFGVGIHL